MLSKSPSRWVESIAVAVQPTRSDLLLVGNFLKTQVVDRTSRGLDADGKMFAPYSQKSAYYYNPYGGDKKTYGALAKNQKSVDRMIKKMGGSTKSGVIRDTTGKALGWRHGMGDTIKFRNYAAFKRALGRAGVDLTGPRAPHMMQALTVRVAEDGVILGIYGEAAGRATGHQYGNPKRGLPQRKFLGATPEDRREIIKLLHAQVQGRLAKRTRP